MFFDDHRFVFGWDQAAHDCLRFEGSYQLPFWRICLLGSLTRIYCLAVGLRRRQVWLENLWAVLTCNKRRHISLCFRTSLFSFFFRTLKSLSRSTFSDFFGLLVFLALFSNGWNLLCHNQALTDTFLVLFMILYRSSILFLLYNFGLKRLIRS